ncbi:MAG: DUF2948 family protein [Pseudomonadota bacterium]
MTSKSLKLLALDLADLTVVSAQVQDALTKPTLIEYSPGNKRLDLVLNRFAWDAQGKAKTGNERRRSVLSFAQVNGLQTKGINRGDDSQILSLLALRFEPSQEPSGLLELTFAGEAAMRLSVDSIEVQLTDLGAAWESRFKPKHPG